MDYETPDAATGETEDPFEDSRDAKPWLDLLEDSKVIFDKYESGCDKIEKLYADLQRLAGVDRQRELQIFWANLEVIKPSIYARAPVPVVTSRFKDRKEISRHASEMLERTLITSFDVEDINETMMGIRDDLAMNARGVMWLRYEADDDSEKVCYDHVDRKDFRHDPARKWKEVGWGSRRTWLTREKMRKRFEPVSGDLWTDAVFTERTIDEQSNQKEARGEQKAAVWELWSKDRGVVVWVSPGVEEVLDIREPFLTLDGFFPFPRPAYGTVEPRSLVPVPDFVYYKDQVEEIHDLTGRIAALTGALRVKGFYAGGNEDIGEAVETAMKQLDDNAIMIPVANFAALGGAGLKDAIVWMPVDMVATTIMQLVQLRAELIQNVYEITGISDIMRGSTDSNETLGAQQLKSQYGSVRVKDRQAELVRIARDATRIAGEIIAENFAPETIMAMSQYDEVPPQEAIQQQIAQVDQQIQAAMQNPQLMQQAQENPEQAQQLLQQAEQHKQTLANTVTQEAVFAFMQDQRMRPFVLDIETDSTIQPDENAQKQRATEFLGAMAQALGQLGPMVAAQPQSAPFAAEVLKFAVAPFRAGRDLEAAIDEFTDNMKQAAAEPKPDPEGERLKAEGEAKQAEMQMKAQEMRANFQVKQMEVRLKESELEIKKSESASKMELDKLRAEVEESKVELEVLRTQMEAARIGREFDQRDADRDAQPKTVN